LRRICFKPGSLEPIVLGCPYMSSFWRFGTASERAVPPFDSSYTDVFGTQFHVLQALVGNLYAVGYILARSFWLPHYTIHPAVVVGCASTLRAAAVILYFREKQKLFRVCSAVLLLIDSLAMCLVHPAVQFAVLQARVCGNADADARWCSHYSQFDYRTDGPMVLQQLMSFQVLFMVPVRYSVVVAPSGILTYYGILSALDVPFELIDVASMSMPVVLCMGAKFRMEQAQTRVNSLLEEFKRIAILERVKRCEAEFGAEKQAQGKKEPSSETGSTFVLSLTSAGAHSQLQENQTVKDSLCGTTTRMVTDSSVQTVMELGDFRFTCRNCQKPPLPKSSLNIDADQNPHVWCSRHPLSSTSKNRTRHSQRCNGSRSSSSGSSSSSSSSNRRSGMETSLTDVTPMVRRFSRFKATPQQSVELSLRRTMQCWNLEASTNQYCCWVHEGCFQVVKRIGKVLEERCSNLEGSFCDTDYKQCLMCKSLLKLGSSQCMMCGANDQPNGSKQRL